MKSCPFRGCTRQADTEEEIEDHVNYMKLIQDPGHEEENRRQ